MSQNNDISNMIIDSSSGHVFNEPNMNMLHEQDPPQVNIFHQQIQQNRIFAPNNPREVAEQNFYGGQNTARLRKDHSKGNQPGTKNTVIHMKTLAMEELDKLARMRKPMWTSSVADSTNLELNEMEYFKTFKNGFGPRIQTLKLESSRHFNGFVINPLALVDIFMDVNRWKNIFNAIVANSMVLEVLSTGREGNHDGRLQVMSVELHTLSPLVPTRQNIIARYCKQLGEGRWGIVDFSIDTFRPDHLIKYRKRPSGCIIENLHHGFTMVTWIEIVEVDDNGVHPFYKPLVNSGLAFGAKRWLGILEKQIDRFYFVMSRTSLHVSTILEDKRIITQLAERMVETYNAAVSSAAGHPWSIVDLKEPYEMRVLMQRNNDNPRHPVGIILSAASSFWLNAPPRKVFDYLCSTQTRANWDILSNESNPKEISHTLVGRDDGSCVSLLQMNNDQMLVILQEAIWDPLGAYMIYAPVEVNSLNMVMNGGDSNYVAMLPSGFVVVPDGSASKAGSLVTVSFQLLVDTCPTAILDGRNAEMVTNLVKYNINKLKTALCHQGLGLS